MGVCILNGMALSIWRARWRRPRSSKLLIQSLSKQLKRRSTVPLSSAEALVFLGFNITMRYISLHFTWRIWEHERSRWAKERRRLCGGERHCTEMIVCQSQYTGRGGWRMKVICASSSQSPLSNRRKKGTCQNLGGLAPPAPPPRFLRPC
jgi:hypothetical protein